MNDMKRKVHRTAVFKSDYKKAKKQGKDIALLLKIIEMLANDETLPENHRDHALAGNWIGYRECHVTPDWLLVYRKTDKDELMLILARLASHSDLDF